MTTELSLDRNKFRQFLIDNPEYIYTACSPESCPLAQFFSDQLGIEVSVDMLEAVYIVEEVVHCINLPRWMSNYVIIVDSPRTNFGMFGQQEALAILDEIPD